MNGLSRGKAAFRTGVKTTFDGSNDDEIREGGKEKRKVTFIFTSRRKEEIKLLYGLHAKHRPTFVIPQRTRFFPHFVKADRDLFLCHLRNVFFAFVTAETTKCETFSTETISPLRFVADLALIHCQRKRVQKMNERGL